MASKLWEKNVQVDKGVEDYTVGRDREMDLYLAPYDILGSLAHITMLESIGLLEKSELEVLAKELKNIYAEAVAGRFVIEPGIEDVHSQVELMLTRKLGDMGKKIHSGRSRNDQVLVDLKLFMRSEIEMVCHAVEKLFSTLIAQSDRYHNCLIPGYTHLQVAMPSSIGLWLDAKTLNAYADSLVTFASAEELLKMKLVDQVAYYDEVRAEIKKRLGLDEDDNISQVSVTQMCAQPNKNKADDRIAVYYAYGDIVSDAQSEMTNGASICSANVVPDLEALMNDDDVKAVVLRVNSPGGSAYASEQIWRAVTRLKAKKPVVVSMGTYAASGGYYISCAANYIYAEPTTLTGSIGIFGMFPDVSGLLTDKLGLKFDQVKTNKYSNFGTTSRPFNEEEMQYLTNMIDRGYKTFTKRVSDGRKIPVERVYEMQASGILVYQ